MIQSIVTFLLLASLLAGPLGPDVWSTDLAEPGTADPTWLTLPTALTEARETGRPALVYVRAAWCGPCRRIERETFPDPAVQDRLARFALAKLTFDERDRSHRAWGYRMSEAAWTRHLGAETTPAFVILSPGGDVLGRTTGFLPPDGLLAILDAALAETQR